MARLGEPDGVFRSSSIFKKVDAFLEEAEARRTQQSLTRATPTERAQSVGPKLVDDLTTMRIVTLTVLFFLVHLLVRLYQYSIRMSGFWESRGDAILLAQSFANGEHIGFDDLVRALAPDTYDFKPTPRSLFGWPIMRRE